MKNSKLVLAAVLLSLGFAILACEASASTAKIAEAWLSTDEAGSSRTTSFSQDAVFFAQVDLRNAPDDSLVKAVWTAVNVENTAPDFLIQENEISTGSAVIFFQLSNTSLWPLGDYKVDLYLNGNLDKTLEFNVR